MLRMKLILTVMNFYRIIQILLTRQHKLITMLAEGGFVNLKVYNILGIEVATLVNEYKPAGSYQVSFDGDDLSSGVYIYNLSVNDFTNTRKMILEK